MEDSLSTGFLLTGLGICLVLSAFFSSAETAFFSLTQSIIAELKGTKDAGSRRVTKLLDRPKELLVTILTGNALVNVSIAVIAALLALRICSDTGFPASFGLAIEVVLVTGVILVLGEITPKIVALKHARTWAIWISLSIKIVQGTLFPITWLLNLISSSLSVILGVERRRLSISQEEIKTLVEVSEERGALEEDEKEMIQGIFEISETTVKEIMVPRVDIACLPITATAHEVIRLVKERGHSRIPIYHENMDNIAGIIHVKDLLPYFENGDYQVDLQHVLREAVFVPEGKKIDDLMRQFQREKFHMAIVVDEYGGTAGLVTLEDVLEEIVGEIQDEYDREVPLYERIDENVLIADARINIDELNEVLGEELIPENDDYETLGGFFFAQTGEMPQLKESLNYHDYHFVVQELSGKRIGKIRIEKQQPPDERGPE